MLSWSQISRLSSCHRSWYLSYVDKITRVSDKVNYSMVLGKAFHRAMETYILYRDYNIGLESFIDSGECPPTMVVTVDLDITGIMHYYIPYIRDLLDNKYQMLNSVSTEYTIKTDNFVGMVDAIFEDRETGEIVVVDFKLRKRLGYSDKYYMDGQLPMYVSVIDTLPAFAGVDVSSYQYWEFSATLPKPARMLKSGKLSTAAQDTTWEYWLETVPVNVKIDEEYWRMILQNKLKQQDDYFRIEAKALTPNEKAHMLSMISNSQDIIDMITSATDDNGNIVPTKVNGTMSNWICKMCEFKTLCSSDITATNYSHLIGSEYEIKRAR